MDAKITQVVAAKVKPKLVDNVEQWWRFWSIRLGIVGTAIVSYCFAAPDAALQAWAILPQDLKDFLPKEYLPFVGVSIFILSMLARLVKQKKLEE